MDNTLIHSQTGWQPTYTPEKTLEEIYEWLLTHEIMLRPILA
ncbi:MAG: hypothetical protein ACFB0G_04130 [Leptolyngbyaceae cyanobacterium]